VIHGTKRHIHRLTPLSPVLRGATHVMTPPFGRGAGGEVAACVWCAPHPFPLALPPFRSMQSGGRLWGEPFLCFFIRPPGFLPPVFSAIAKHAPCLAAWGQSGGQRKGKEAHLTIDVWFPDGYGEMQYDITWSPIRGPLGRG
jgi:hypothetical protein